MHKRLNFLVVGVQKAATTSLDQYLRLNPNVAMPRGKKELHYFDKFENYSKGAGFYQSYFDHVSEELVWGECTPIYCYWHGVLEKIYHYNPDIKLIMLLRNPIERAFSHWNMEYKHGRESLDFYDALINEGVRLANMPNKQHRVFSYIDRCRYSTQIKKIWDVFGKDKLLIMKMDDLIEYPKMVMDLVWDFLEVEKIEIKSNFCSYAGDYQKKMTNDEKAFLLKNLKSEILKLEDLLDWDCKSWLNI